MLIRCFMFVALLSCTSTLLADCVVLLHGMGRSAYSMKALEWRLQDEGYQVVNKSYPSNTQTIEDLAELAVPRGVKECQRSEKAGKIHFVTHSLGGILVRQYTETRPIEDMGRVVMLGPPNQGSQMADYVNSLAVVNSFSPRPTEQLGTDDNSVPLRLGAVDFYLGVIAGTKARKFFGAAQLEQGPSDGTVLVSETRVDGMADFITMPATHTYMMMKDTVIDQVVFFLANGKFNRSDDA